jgi:putative FmdB family regulatory protein
VPIYDYRCDCGVRFERLVARDAPTPPCPQCGGEARKVPSRPALHGTADPGPSKEYMPQTWKGTHRGNREYVTGLQRQWEKRERLEAQHPELRGDTRPVAAHEGRYENAPLRAGEPYLGPGSSGSSGSGDSSSGGHGHGHGHGHSH